MMGRRSLANDANPLARTLTSAKTSIPSRRQVFERLEELRLHSRQFRTMLDRVPGQIRMLYSDQTLRQLVFLREALDRTDCVDVFLTATVLGMLHANHERGKATRGFSISMPNTFAMSPRYVEKYIREHNLSTPEVDVFDMLTARMMRLDLPSNPVSTGTTWSQDARIPFPSQAHRQANLILTSPPYLQVIKYGKYNWVRLWFLGEEPADVDEKLVATASMKKYLCFMRDVCDNLQGTLTPDGLVCLVIGDVTMRTSTHRKTLNLAEKVWTDALEPAGWHLHGLIADEIPTRHKVSRIWKQTPGSATKTDRLLIVSQDASRRLPDLPHLNWSRDFDSRDLDRKES